MLEERIEATTTPTEYEKRTYTVSEIQDILGIGRVSAYSLVKSNVFRSVRVGTRSEFPSAALMLGSMRAVKGAIEKIASLTETVKTRTM